MHSVSKGGAVMFKDTAWSWVFIILVAFALAFGS